MVAQPLRFVDYHLIPLAGIFLLYDYAFDWGLGSPYVLPPSEGAERGYRNGFPYGIYAVLIVSLEEGHLIYRRAPDLTLCGGAYDKEPHSPVLLDVPVHPIEYAHRFTRSSLVEKAEGREDIHHIGGIRLMGFERSHPITRRAS